jgi:ribosomal protein L16 Arg81 hydroxylase
MKLDELLAPVTLDEFLATNWCRSPFHVSGRRDRFVNLGFDLEEMRRVLPTRRSDVAIKAQFADAAGRHREMPVAASQIQECFDAGMTICLGPVEDVLPQMREQVAELVRASGFAGSLPFMCYWSSKGAGFGWHYDEVGVFILQIRGSKRWWYSRSVAVECPFTAFAYSREAADEELAREGIDVGTPPGADAETVLLEPGDVLYLPAGTWHRTAAEGPESVALTMGTVSGTPARLVTRSLESWLRADRSWRRALPFVDPAVLVRGELSPSVERELSSRLAMLKTHVSELTVADLVRTWLRECQ